MKIPAIKSKLKRLSKDFFLKYSNKWFDFLQLSKRENILLEYLLGCPDPIYKNYGLNLSQKIKNFDKFINSTDFKKCTKRYGGQVLKKSDLKSLYTIQNKIKSNELKVIYKKLSKKLQKKDTIAIITKTDNPKEQKHLSNILFHEWIHILINKNSLNSKDWGYNEGLCTYFEAYANKQLNQLEQLMKKEKYPMEKQYYKYAIKFRDKHKRI